MTYILSEHVEENTYWDMIIENEGLVVECADEKAAYRLRFALNNYRLQAKKQLPELAHEYEKYIVRLDGNKLRVEPRTVSKDVKIKTLSGENINIEDYIHD